VGNVVMNQLSKVLVFGVYFNGKRVKLLRAKSSRTILANFDKYARGKNFTRQLTVNSSLSYQGLAWLRLMDNGLLFLRRE
jgi:hypothetical protein